MSDPSGPGDNYCNLRVRILDDGGLMMLNSMLAEDLTLSFGSGADNDHMVSGDGIAAEHFILGYGEGGIWIESVGRAITALDGQDITGRVPASTKFEVEIGSASIQFDVELPGAKPLSPSSLIGLVVGGYRIESVIGQGLIDIVYRATQVALDREVAIKILKPIHVGTNDEITRRFLRMVEVSGQLNHPNLVQVFDSGFDKSRNLHYIVMEILDGCQTLGEVLAECERLDAEIVTGQLLQMVSALDYLHERDIIHRNVHPGNVIVLPGKKVKLAGLGNVLTMEEAASTESSLHSPEDLENSIYLAPELFRTDSYDSRSDLYSVAAVAYRALTGLPPTNAASPIMHFQGIDEGDRVSSVLRSARGTPAKLAEVVDTCLNPDPALRYPTAAAIRGELRSLVTPTGKHGKVLARMKDHLSAMLPDAPQIPKLETAVLFRPSEGVGGDFYDMFPCQEGEEWGVVVGDVTGHGMEAYSVAGMAKMAIRIFSRRTKGPRNALVLAHRELMQDLSKNTFVSTVLLRINPVDRKLVYARAGQIPPLLYNPRRDPDISVLDSPGMALGMLKSADLKVEEHKLLMLPGDLVLLLTDGITEITDSDKNQFGLDRLIGFVREHYDETAEQMALHLAGELEQFATGEAEQPPPQTDDWTALFLKLA